MKRLISSLASLPLRRVLITPPTPSAYYKTTCQIYHSSVIRSKTAFILPSRAMSADRNVDLSYEEIVDLSAKKEITLVDVRENNEIQETGKLPGSIHIPLGELPAALQSTAEDFQAKYDCTAPGKDAELVFSCRSGMRSRKALVAAKELGFTNSRHYAGGFMDWQEKTK